MSQYEPNTLSELGSVLDAVCRALHENGRRVSTELREAIRKRLFELYDEGVTARDRLWLEMMADRLESAAHRHRLAT